MIYLDNAATSWPKPESVYRAMDEFARKFAGNPGRSGHRMAVESEARVQGCREALARLLHAESADRVILTLNATDALNIALKGLLRKGDHVITSHIEHNSINRPLARLAAEGFLTYDKAPSEPDGSVATSSIQKLIRKNTKLIAITQCSNVLGVINPVEEVAKLGVKTLIDASQSVGAMPLDVRPFDLVAFPGHKNLFGPMGTGALYVRPGIDLDFFREGGSGFKAEEERHPTEMPFRLEGGTPNAHGFAGLLAGIEFVEKEGVEKIGRHERELALKFADGLRDNKKVTVYSCKNRERSLGPVSLRIQGLDAQVPGDVAQRHGPLQLRLVQHGGGRRGRPARRERGLGLRLISSIC
jgi:selenocysteine lyase/cysteine desulfurase